MRISAIITGVTGMVGEGVLQESLNHPEVEKVLVITRKPCGITHPKLTEILHSDFYDLSTIKNKLKGYNACFFCLGVTSVGKKEDEYFSLTHTLTMHMAEILARQNNDMTFCYVSGAGTDSSERGRISWARVKGKTENDLRKLPFKKAYAIRPGFMLPAKDAKNIPWFFPVFRLIYPLLRMLFPKYVSTLKELSIAMINTVIYDYEKPVLEVKDLVDLAKREHNTSQIL
jgi:uncharacterized protein YbjT (DUF2867 family)